MNRDQERTRRVRKLPPLVERQPEDRHASDTRREVSFGAIIVVAFTLLYAIAARCGLR